MIWIDGALVDDVAAAAEAAATDGALFETIGRFGGDLPLWDRHVARLAAGLARVGDPAPMPDGLRQVAAALLRANGHDVVRLERRLRPRGGSWRMVTRRREGAGQVVRLVPTLARRPQGAPPADLKAMPRPYWEALRAEARQSGADDGIALGDDGALLETSTANLWLLLDSVWTTPPLDGRVLPGVARALLLARAGPAGIPVAQRPLDLGDLHRATSMCVTNAVHGVRAACLVGTDVAEDGTSLARLWRFAVGD